MMRHVMRTHRVNLDWLLDLFLKDVNCHTRYATTKEQAGDIFTKGSFTQSQFQALMRLISVVSASELFKNGKPLVHHIQGLDKDDVIMQCGDMQILIDPKSLVYLDGTELDYVKEGLNEGFQFRNPNVKNECGCGESFHV